ITAFACGLFCGLVVIKHAPIRTCIYELFLSPIFVTSKLAHDCETTHVIDGQWTLGLYINDIKNVISCSCQIYADDIICRKQIFEEVNIKLVMLTMMENTYMNCSRTNNEYN